MLFSAASENHANIIEDAQDGQAKCRTGILACPLCSTTGHVWLPGQTGMSVLLKHPGKFF